MYTEFYNLREKPFNLTPSPRYLYLGEVHKEALALLTYGVVERKGFILLTGEIGTGKTTLIQSLLANLDEDVLWVHISNPLLSTEEFMDYLAFSVFSKKVHFRSKADFLVEFEEFLKESLRDQKNFVLIIDEAQKLSFELLEEIRLLSNMETADEKLINIFLVGQPELNDRLNDPRCKPLLQRISTRYHMAPLDLEGVQEYMATRMKVAGAKDVEKIFTKAAVKAIYQYSEGYPRMVNILADNALLLGYSQGVKKITPEMVKECYRDIRPDNKQSYGEKQRPAPKVFSEGRAGSGRRYWKWAAALLIVLLAVFFAGNRGHEILQDAGILHPPIHSVEEPAAGDQTISVVKKQIEKVDEPLVAPVAEPVEVPPLREEEAPGQQTEIGPFAALTPPELPKKAQEEKPQEPKGEWQRVVVQEGDTLTGLAVRIYGSATQEILDLLRSHNPGISDLNWIKVGDVIVFPPLAALETPPTYTVQLGSFESFSLAKEFFNKLLGEGYEVYLLPAQNGGEKKIFRVSVGSFEELAAATDYARHLVEGGVSDDAKPILLNVQ